MTDGTDALCIALYGRVAEPRDYLGGAEAQMLRDAARRLKDIRFVSAASGLQYSNPDAAGDISGVMFRGRLFTVKDSHACTG